MGKNQNNNCRYERKFFINNADICALESLILDHPAFFREIYHERRVNNIYFDYLNFNNFYDNIYGNTNRIKNRIRWYGKTFSIIENSNIELKIIKGMVGYKK